MCSQIDVVSTNSNRKNSDLFRKLITINRMRTSQENKKQFNKSKEIEAQTNQF